VWEVYVSGGGVRWVALVPVFGVECCSGDTVYVLGRERAPELYISGVVHVPWGSLVAVFLFWALKLFSMYLVSSLAFSVFSSQKNSGALASNEDPLPLVPNRFSSVIERIERLYKVTYVPGFWAWIFSFGQSLAEWVEIGVHWILLAMMRYDKMWCVFSKRDSYRALLPVLTGDLLSGRRQWRWQCRR